LRGIVAGPPAKLQVYVEIPWPQCFRSDLPQARAAYTHQKPRPFHPVVCPGSGQYYVDSTAWVLITLFGLLSPVRTSLSSQGQYTPSRLPFHYFPSLHLLISMHSPRDSPVLFTRSILFCARSAIIYINFVAGFRSWLRIRRPTFHSIDACATQF
jgi:hypothetical protein